MLKSCKETIIMAYSERSNDIIDYLKTHKSATVEELARLLYVSEATIRRDLTAMQRLGQIERSHGGAILSESSDELSILIRQAKNSKEKMRTATVALKHLPDFQTVFIDNSSTCLALANRMDFSHKTVVTNGLQLAMYLSNQDIATLILLGGEIRGHSAATMGSMAETALRDFRFDLALLSCAAMDAGGSYELVFDTMLTKRTAISRSKHKILLFDNTKINANSPYCTTELDTYDALITDADDSALTDLRAAFPHIYNE